MSNKLLKILISFLLFLLPLNTWGETIRFSADTMSGKAGSKSDITTLTGNAWVKTESMEIKADNIELYGENFRFINATGNVSGVNSESQMDFTCGKMKYDRNTKIAQLEDTVHLVDKANNVTADAQLIEYNQNTEIAIMQIGVSIKQKDNLCTSAYAIYRKTAQKLEMSGNPKIKQGEDTFRAQEISLNLDTQEILLDGRVSGTVTDSKKSKADRQSQVDEDKDENKEDSSEDAIEADDKTEEEKVKDE